MAKAHRKPDGEAEKPKKTAAARSRGRAVSTTPGQASNGAAKECARKGGGA